MPASGRRKSFLERFRDLGPSHPKHSTHHNPVLPLSEQTPLLPLTQKDISSTYTPPPASVLDPLGSANGNTGRSSRSIPFGSPSSPTNDRHKHVTFTMTSHPSPSVQRGRKSAILGASRKVVSTVKKPLRAVGRVVRRRSRNGDLGSEDGMYSADEISVEDCGTIEGPQNDEGSMNGGSVVMPLNDDPPSSRRENSQRAIIETALSATPSDPNWPVHSMEQIMRTTILMCGAYILGCKRPEFQGIVTRTSEYALTAWATCVVILGLAYLQRKFSQGASDVPQGGGSLVQRASYERTMPSKARSSRELTQDSTHTHDLSLPDKPPVSIIDRATSIDSSVMSAPEINHPHPKLASLHIIDADSGERIIPNTEGPTHVSTEYFDMDMMVMLRTPDVDDPNAEKGQPCNDQWVKYLRGRQRCFEFQYQIRLKKLPEDQAVYFSCEVDEPIKMGMIQRAFVGAAMAFMKSTNPTFHYSITGSKERSADGSFEKPHMAFTVEGSLNRLVVTKPGEEPPKLGTPVEESAESIKRRKKGGLVDWNLEDTYTMALWSAYVDFLDWRVINLPGIRPFGLRSVLGAQPFRLGMYLIDNKRGNDKHYQKDITMVVDLELSNEKEAHRGPLAEKCHREAKKNRGLPGRESSADDLTIPVSTTPRPLNMERSRSIDGDMTNEDIEEEDEDAETAAELGAGIYMRSGDSVCLRKFNPNAEDENCRTFSVANGGGFAVLQEQDVTIIVEKTRRSKKHRLIKAGDTVMFKMIQNKNSGNETRYLTIHRGWWLKWVLTVPSKNGYFTIYPHDSEFGKSMRSSETQTSYLTINGFFKLKHKRWSSYYVGIAAEPSVTYGGRMLGLYNPSRADHMADEQYQPDDGEADDGEVDIKTGKGAWMKPLILTPVEPPNLMVPSLPVTSRPRDGTAKEFGIDEATRMMDPTKLIFSSEHAQADVPAWVEMMNRTQRERQLTYVVRVTQWAKDENKIDDNELEATEVERQTRTFVRLRNGRELASIMRVGQSAQVRNYNHESPVKGKRGDRRNTLDKTASTGSMLAASRHGGSTHAPSPDTPRSPEGQIASSTLAAKLSLSPRGDKMPSGGLAADFSFESLAEDSEGSSESAAETLFEEDGDEALHSTIEDVEDETENPDIESETESEIEVEQTTTTRRKKKGVVGKSKRLLGKSIKATAGGVVKSTKLTGKVALATGKLSAKAVVGAGKLTGKAGKKAVNVGKMTGRAVIAPVTRKSKNPPKKKEPKTKKKDRASFGLSRTMKKMAKREKKKAGPPVFMAGELCAPEQSRQTASRVLSRMSQVPVISPHWKKFNAALTSQTEFETEPDRWFLEGTAVELGVVPLSGESSRGKIIHESLVARCLWESHWREEWCGMYDSCLSFYTPLSRSPSNEIAYIDITGVRPLDARNDSPLPGFPILVLETAWLCQYLAFHDEESRDTFGEKVEAAIEKHIKQVEESASLQEDELRKARFWQGFQSLSESSLSTGGGKWAKLPTKDKLKQRTILNGRRMAFDPLEHTMTDKKNGFAFVEELLRKALSFSFESLEQNPHEFVEFLDLSSQLRLLALEEIDLSSKHAFCLFANIYHCLFQQALLLSVNGPLHKRSLVSFMRTACYEIGGDVFSLAELYCCVLRGKMSKPANPKPPYIEAPKKSQGYRYYALDYNDPRVNFVLNTGDVACPRHVPVLRPDKVEEQLNHAAELFLQGELTIDPKRRTVILPKICEVYKSDFGGDSTACLKFCMGGLDEGVASTIRLMSIDMGNITIRYKPTSEQYHASLKLKEEEWPPDDDQVDNI